MRLYKKPSTACFTLPELMVVMTIGIMISYFFVKMIDTVRKTVSKSNQQVDMTAKTRFVFDRISNDLKNMPRRTDMDYYMSNDDAEDDFLRFISQVRGVDSDRELSLVGYKIQKNSKGILGIYRGVHGYQWSDVGFMGISTNGIVPNLMHLSKGLDLKEKDYELLADGVLKVGLAFQYKNDGKIYKKPPFFYVGTNNTILHLQITNIASIVVGLVLVDLKKNPTLSEEVCEKLANKFTQPDDGVTPLPHWNTNYELNFSQFSKDLPKPIAESIQIYQRFFQLD